jgi:hypothetical protein
LDVAAKGTANSLIQWFPSEHVLSGITFLGHSLVLLGFLYLSYDLLARPQGILRWLFIVFTHIVVSIVALLVFAPPLLFLFQQLLRATNIPPDVVDPTNQIADIIIFTLMIGVLQGIFIASPHPGSTVKKFLWRDCLIGLVFALVFFSIDEYAIFHTPIEDVIDTIPDFLQFVFIGAVGGGFWYRYGQGSHHRELSHVPEEEWRTYHFYEIVQGKDEPGPSFFSFADFSKGFLFWYIIIGLSTILWIATTISLFGLGIPGWYFYLVDLFIGAAPASLICGSSQYITWKVHHLGEKQLGIIGAILTLFGLSLVLIEPLVLFFTKP